MVASSTKEQGDGGRESGRISRRTLMALTGGSVAAVALASCGGDGETSDFGDGDVGILNYVMTLEHLEYALYAEAIDGGLFAGTERRLLRGFRDEEGEHVGALSAAVKELGGTPAAEPRAAFGLKAPESALELMGTIENLGAAAYLAQLPRIESSSALKTVISIFGVEGRHAAAIDTLQGKPSTPEGPFAKPAKVDEVLKAIEPFMIG